MQERVLRDLRDVNLGLDLGHEFNIVEGFQVDRCTLKFVEDSWIFLCVFILCHSIQIAVLKQLFFSIDPDEFLSDDAERHS